MAWRSRRGRYGDVVRSVGSSSWRTGSGAGSWRRPKQSGARQRHDTSFKVNCTLGHLRSPASGSPSSPMRTTRVPPGGRASSGRPRWRLPCSPVGPGAQDPLPGAPVAPASTRRAGRAADGRRLVSGGDARHPHPGENDPSEPSAQRHHSQSSAEQSVAGRPPGARRLGLVPGTEAVTTVIGHWRLAAFILVFITAALPGGERARRANRGQSAGRSLPGIERRALRHGDRVDGLGTCHGDGGPINHTRSVAG